MSTHETVTSLGKIDIAEEAIAMVAGIAAMECYGLVGMASRRIKDGLVELLGRENLTRGVEVKFLSNGVAIRLYIIVGYGVRISEVANNVMSKVKYMVESLLGLKVESVSVHVEGVRVGNR